MAFVLGSRSLRKVGIVGSGQIGPDIALHMTKVLEPDGVAVVVVDVDGEKRLSVSESLDEDGADRGPVNALSKALVKDLGKYSSLLDDMRLVDFKVRITQGGTEATTRVIIDSEDGQGRRWSTVGVSANILDASFEALLDAIRWKLIRDRAQ